MAKSTITNGQDGAGVRSALNTMFSDLYGGRHPGYIAGNWYMPMYSSSATGIALPIDSIRCLPFVLLQPVTITNLGLRVTTGAAGNIKCAIYANNAATGRPTGAALASTANMSSASAAMVSAAIAETSVTLQPGIYWQCVWVDTNNAIVCRTQTAAVGMTPQLIGSATEATINNATTSSIFTIACAKTYGAWPNMTSESFTEATGTANATLHFKAG